MLVLTTNSAWHFRADTQTDYIVQSSKRQVEILTSQRSSAFEIEVRKLYPRLGVYGISIRANSSTSTDDILNSWLNSGLINKWYSDQPVERRFIPNDAFYPEQWDMDRIDTEAAWMLTTGGVTSNGDTIVVAVLDSGFEIDHIDLAENIWFGASCAIDDGMVVVGATLQTTSYNRDGAAYIFDTAGNQLAKLVANDAFENLKFGSTVDIDGGIVVVGNSASQEAGVYLFDASTGTQLLKISVTVENFYFGSAVAISEDVTIANFSSMCSTLHPRDQDGMIREHKHINPADWIALIYSKNRTEGVRSILRNA